MVCCDTNFLIDLLRKNVSAYSKLEQLGETDLTTTIINVAELYRGAYRTADINKELNHVKELLDNFTVLNLDGSGCDIYGKLSSKLRSQSLGDADLLIASITISNRESLLTKDGHFSRIDGLSTDTW